MSSSRIDTNVSFVKIEIGTSEPSEVRINIEGSPYVLGRSADSAMRFIEQRVSRKHATIEIVNGKASLVDQSRAGTWVNGVPLVKNQPFPLMVGDVINLGSEDTVLMVGGEGGGTLEYFLTRNPNPKPELELDEAGRAVLKNGFNIDQPLTPTEFDVLAEMYRRKGQVITFEQIWAIMHHNEPSETFNAKVAQEGVTGEKTVPQLAAEYGVEQHRVDAWIKELIKKDAGVCNRDQDNGEVMPVDNKRIHQSISGLRKKIERPDSKPVIVLTVTGLGYKVPKFLGD
jgi:pSer/pThr/pTyr-binding forkhead associated (FHA) protein